MNQSIPKQKNHTFGLNCDETKYVNGQFLKGYKYKPKRKPRINQGIIFFRTDTDGIELKRH